MTDHNDFRTGRHVVYARHAHLVFLTKYRHPVFTTNHLDRMEEIMRQVCDDFETKLVEFNGEDNHVHPLVHFPPKVTLSNLVNSIKGVSSRLMRTEFEDLRGAYWKDVRLWSGSHLAGSVDGAPLATVRQYIEDQTHPPQ